VGLEEHTLESVGDRCEVCGTELTSRESEAALEAGGPALCSVHLAELEPALAEEALEEE
jgi:hypothetical protein